MASMYELMLQLPIFQGISRSQLTKILEKTSFHFDRFNTGEVIYELDQKAEHIIFIISGEVRLTTPTFGGKMQIQEDFYAPHTMPFQNFFGVDTFYRSELVALQPTGIMLLDKTNFLNVLQQNMVLLVNVLNILSSHAQKQHKGLDFSSETNPLHRLASWMLAYTNRPAHNIILNAKVSDWCNMLHLDQAEFWRAVAELEGRKCVEVDKDRIKLTDRYGLRAVLN